MQEESLTEQFLRELDDFEEETSEVKREGVKINELETDEQTIEFFKNELSNTKKDYIEKLKEELGASGVYKNALDSIESPEELSNDEQGQILIDSNSLITQINQTVRSVHMFLMHVYSEKFPGLESLVSSPVDYSKCIVRIGHKRNISDVNFDDILSNHSIVAVKMAANSNKGDNISEKNLELALKGANFLLEIFENCQKLISFVEKQMTKIAPNLSAVVGTKCAAQLVASAGGIQELAMMPACNVQVLGSQKGQAKVNNNLGFAKKGQSMYHGHFASIEMVQKAPEEFRTKLVKMFANYASKASKIDLAGTDPLGIKGKEQKNKLVRTFKKRTERPEAQKRKAIVIKEKPAKKRGGRKYRKMRERMMMTEAAKFKNRLFMSDKNAQIEDMETGIGFGQLSQANIGKLRIDKKKQKMNLNKKQKKMIAHKINQGGKATGLVSSLVFAPNQGIELVDPSYVKSFFEKKASSDYFSKDSGFKTVLKQKSTKPDQ